VWSVVKEQDDVAQLSLHLGVDLHVVTRRSNAVETCRLR
jgi:hypothetical protein